MGAHVLSSAQTDVTGFVAVDSTNEEVVVAFRGSSSVRNWLTNVNAEDIDSDLCDGCTVHQGFWRSWLEARSGIITALEEAADENPGFEVVATGHSLGGALATLAAADLRNDGYPVTLVSLSSPASAAISRGVYFILDSSSSPLRLTNLSSLNSILLGRPWWGMPERPSSFPASRAGISE